MSASFALFSLLIFVQTNPLNGQSIEKELTNGRIQGQIVTLDSKQYGVFTNIPYAKPPLATRRFQEPIKEGPWPGILDAAGPSDKICPQSPYDASTQSEDCLYLDVYTPEATESSRGSYAVMVWIHGGSFKLGNKGGNELNVILRTLVSHDVLVVMVNYRLSSLGFFTDEKLGILGNQGLLDQILALEWVQDNIQSFGGDPGWVTIFGESSGGESCSLLTLSPMGKGLFSQAIIMSGSGWHFSMMELEGSEQTKTASKLLIEKLGCSTATDVMRCIQSADLASIIAKADEAEEAAVKIMGPVFGPVIGDKKVLPHSISELSQNRRPIPIIDGTTADEWAIFEVWTLVPTMPADPVTSEAELRTKIELLLQMGPFGAENDRVRQLIVEQYIEKFKAKNPRNALNGSHWIQQSVDMHSTLHLHYPAYLDAKALVDIGSKVYLYSFEYYSKEKGVFKGKDWKWEGSVHGSDVFYMLGLGESFFGTHMYKPTVMTQDDLKIRNLFGLLWTNFVKTGNPTPEPVEGVIWSEYEPEQGNYLNLDWTQFQMKQGFHQDELNFWNGIMKHPEGEETQFGKFFTHVRSLLNAFRRWISSIKF